MKYVKCPRCDLNYMPETEKYCDVCKAELKIGPGIKFVSFGDDEDSDQILCPVCKRNYMDPGEEMCSECREEKNDKAAIEPEQDVDPDSDEEWRNYLDEDEKEAISNKVEDGEEMLSLDKLGEEEANTGNGARNVNTEDAVWYAPYHRCTSEITITENKLFPFTRCGNPVSVIGRARRISLKTPPDFCTV